MTVAAVQAVLLGLFFLSGACGLIYQVVWSRMLVVTFGSTTLAISTVLSSFMAGLALGSFVFGRIADRRRDMLRMYAILEVGIGVSAMLVPVAFSGLRAIYPSIYRGLHESFYPFSLVRFLLCFAVLIVPTALMGGTLPVLSRFFIRRYRGIGAGLGRLYSINTFGAMVGCFVAGFLLVEFAGVRGAGVLAAVLNLLVAGVTLLLIRYGGEAAGPEREIEPAAPERTRRTGLAILILCAFGLSGFASIAYEVLWTRVLVYVLSSSVYAFTVMLTTFLGGIAIGSVLFVRYARRDRDYVRVFGAVEILIGLFAAASIPILGNLFAIHEWVRGLFGGITWWDWNSAKFVESALVMLPAAILMGTTFPLVGRIYTRALDRLGGSVGTVYSVNTVGGVIGSFCAGFVLAPALGVQRSLVLLAALNLALGGLILSIRAGRAAHRVAILVPLLGAIVLLAGIPNGMFARTFNEGRQDAELVFWKEGIAGTLTVQKYPDGRRVFAIDGISVAGTALPLRTTQKLQAHIPLMTHPDPKRVLQIGFGSGETAKVVRLYDVDIDVAEISPDVIPVSTRFFADLNDRVAEGPRFRTIVMDGKNYALLAEEKYDVVMNDATYPGSSGSSALYTEDHFRGCRTRLNPGGVLSCWVPIDLAMEDFRMIVRSFRAAFPHMSIWLANNCENKHALLVGTVDPFAIDYGRLSRAFGDDRIRGDLEEVGIGNAFELMDSFLMAESAVDRFVEGADLNTDDRPLLEFRVGRHGSTELFWAENLEEMDRHRGSIYPFLTNVPDPDTALVRSTIERYFVATKYALRGQISDLRKVPGGGRRYYQMALSFNPEDRGPAYFLASTRTRRTSLERMVASKTDDPELYVALAEACILEEDYACARDAYESALHLAPTLLAARIGLGEMYARLGQYDRAIETYEQALPKVENRARILTLLGLAYRGQGEHARAMEAFEEAIREDPEDGTAYDNLVAALLWKREYEQAIDRCTEALETQPDRATVRFNLGVAYEGLGIYGQAEASYLRALELDPHMWQVAMKLGTLYARQGASDAAARAFRRAISAMPDAPEPYNALAWLYAESGMRLDEALWSAQTAVSLRRIGPHLDTLGWVYYKRGMYDEAEQTLKEALSMEPGNPTYREHLMEVREKR